MSEGDVISLDGTTGKVVLGEVGLAASEAPPSWTSLLGWADTVRQAAILPRPPERARQRRHRRPDAARARALGAEGIGLCRTEHMFLGDDRLPIVREMIWPTRPAAEAAALEKLRAAQRSDFVEILGRWTACR